MWKNVAQLEEVLHNFYLTMGQLYIFAIIFYSRLILTFGN